MGEAGLGGREWGGKVVKTAVLMALGSPGVFGLIVRAVNGVGLRHDQVLTGLLRSFKIEEGKGIGEMGRELRGKVRRRPNRMLEGVMREVIVGGREEDKEGRRH